MSENNTEQQPQELDRKDLKVLALRQSLGEIQDKFADLQVEATVLQQQLQSAVKEIERLNGVVEEKDRAALVAKASDVSTGDVSTD